MPAISLVVCLYKEREHLQRLLEKTEGLYDDLVVIHDGPEETSTHSELIKNRPDNLVLEFDDWEPSKYESLGYVVPSGTPKPGSIHELVTNYGGRFFAGPRCFQQEPHWPFAWREAKHDWILRLDADEYPSDELRQWLSDFHQNADLGNDLSGYTCLWPVWNGTKVATRAWPQGRNFLFHRGRVSFFGMVEQVPVPDTRFESLPLVLCHRPNRKSHGLLNILRREQGGRWREVIAQSLLREPRDLPQWRWGEKPWPDFWRQLRRRPITAGFYFLLRHTLVTLRDQWRSEGKLMPLIAVATPLHHFLIGVRLHQLRKQH